MRRRDFIVFFAGAMAAWPQAPLAQQPGQKRLVGVLMGFPESDSGAQSWLSAFRSELAKLGWPEGSKLQIEARWAGADSVRISTFAKELIGLRPGTILAVTTPVTGVLVRETSTIPVVFVAVADPIAKTPQLLGSR